MSEFLLEIFSEEIPAKMQINAITEAQKLLGDLLTLHGLDYNNLQAFISPRRISFTTTTLADFTKSLTEQKRGPKINAPEAAVQGFLKANDKKLCDLTQIGDYWYAEIVTCGQPTATVLPQIIIQFLQKFTWAKVMRWSQSKVTWIRPIRNILCIFNQQLIQDQTINEMLGVSMNNMVWGHRFLSTQPFAINNIQDYYDGLKTNNVILCHKTRQEFIKQKLEDCGKELDLSVQLDQDLLDEVTGLVEYPYVAIGQIDAQFMHLPDVVLSTSMKAHQKYFTVRKADGAIANHFAVVSNIPVTDSIINGYEKVLKARLRDADFFWQQDLQTPLLDLSPKLDKVVLHQKLGSVGLKLQRLLSISNDEDLQLAIKLYKTDLLTQMVGEFPELQGIMGQIYAQHQGIDHNVALAIKESYQPNGLSDSVPQSDLGIKLALLDKVDTLVGFLGIGLIPTGSKDPFGLRRAGLGIIRIICENKLELNLQDMIADAVNSYQKQGINLNADVMNIALNFIADRFPSFVKLPNNYINACLKDLNKPYLLYLKCNALAKIIPSEVGQSLIKIFNRCYKIFNSYPDKNQLCPLQPDLMQAASEKLLYQQFNQIIGAYKNNLIEKQHQQAAELITNLVPLIDDFFNEVTIINADDKLKTNNHLKLIAMILEATNTFADFTKFL